MVRILKVKELEERKRLLLARSEMYRQTLTLGGGEHKVLRGLHKRRFNLLLKSSRWLGLAAALAGLFFFRRRPTPSKTRNGFISKLLSGPETLRPAKAFVAGIRGAMHRECQRNEFTRILNVSPLLPQGRQFHCGVTVPWLAIISPGTPIYCSKCSRHCGKPVLALEREGNHLK